MSRPQEPMDPRPPEPANGEDTDPFLDPRRGTPAAETLIVAEPATEEPPMDRDWDDWDDQPEDRGPKRGPLRWIIGLTVLLLAVFLAWDPFHLHPADDWVKHRLGFHQNEMVSESGLWTCGMHPEVIQDEPGQCPICHMDLVPVAADDISTNTMSGEASDPLAGVMMGDGNSTEDHAGHDHGPLYTCPMHPQVLEDEPGNCPICGMKLVPAEVDSTGTAGATARGERAEVTLGSGVIQRMNVKSELVVRQDLVREIRTVGYLDYDQGKMVTVTPKLSGFVEKAYVHYVGEPVRRGQPLYEIYSPELVQTQQELLSARDYARRMAQAPEATRQRAEALLEATRRRLAAWDIRPAQVARIEESGQVLHALTITSPASGLVMKRMPGLEGSAISPGMELFHIANLDSLWLSVEVFEDQLPWLREGARARVTLSYFPGETFTGQVRYVEPQVSETTRTVGLRLAVPNPKGQLRAGMYATVVFDPVAAEDVLVVPSLAVLRTGERNLVVADLGEGRFQPREVDLGLEGRGQGGQGVVQVLRGLEEGERVVTSAQFLIDSESNLREAIQKLLAAKRAQAMPPAAEDGR